MVKKEELLEAAIVAVEADRNGTVKSVEAMAARKLIYENISDLDERKALITKAQDTLKARKTH